MHSHSLVFRAGWLPVQGGPDQSGRVWSDANRHFARESRVPLGQSRTWQYKIRTSHVSPYVQRLSMSELLVGCGRDVCLRAWGAATVRRVLQYDTYCYTSSVLLYYQRYVSITIKYCQAHAHPLQASFFMPREPFENSWQQQSIRLHMNGLQRGCTSSTVFTGFKGWLCTRH